MTGETRENLRSRLDRLVTFETFRAIVGARTTDAAEMARMKLQSGSRLTKAEHKTLELAIRLRAARLRSFPAGRISKPLSSRTCAVSDSFCRAAPSPRKMG
jgi:hypothetical protein